MILLKILSEYLTRIQLVLQKLHLTLFKKLNNKIVIKLKFISISQYLISKFHIKLMDNRYFHVKLIHIQNKGYNLRGSISYHFSKRIVEYIINNNIAIEEFIEELDPFSKDLVKSVIKRMFYIYTHTLINLKELLTPKEINMRTDIMNVISSVRNNVKLPYNRYEASIFYYDCGLKLLPSETIKFLENKDFIDAGAFIGDSAAIFEKNYNSRKIYAFEPEVENYKLLVKTIKENNLQRVIPINKAIGDKHGILKIKTGRGASNISKKGDLSVEIEKVDEITDQMNLDVGLIKMDIEGYALNALKGAEKTIKTFSPVLLISIYHNGEEFFESMEYIRMINPKYKFIIRKLDPLSLVLETTLIGWVE